jgi:hypothetical protein
MISRFAPHRALLVFHPHVNEFFPNRDELRRAKLFPDWFPFSLRQHLGVNQDSRLTFISDTGSRRKAESSELEFQLKSHSSVIQREANIIETMEHRQMPRDMVFHVWRGKVSSSDEQIRRLAEHEDALDSVSLSFCFFYNSPFQRTARSPNPINSQCKCFIDTKALPSPAS